MAKQAYIYFALAAEDAVLGGVLDAETGAIDIRQRMPVSAGPEALAIDPQERFLFVGCYPRYHAGDAPLESRLYSFRIDRQTRALTPINYVSLPGGPTYLAVDRNARFILSAHYRDGKAGVHPLSANGEIGPATQWFDSGGGAHCIQLDPSNRYAFLPHITTSKVNKDTWPPLMSPNHILPSASNTILQFRFDENGILTPNTPFKLPGERGGGPRHYCYHPALNTVYFSNEQGCAVTVYALNPADGTLTPLQYVSTLSAEGYDGYASCSDIGIAHSGRFVFVLNRGYDTVACFAVDPVTGRLKLTALVPTEAQSHTLAIDPDDRFLFVAGHESGRLATYRIEEDGALCPLETRPLGKRPKDIIVTGFEAARKRETR